MLSRSLPTRLAVVLLALLLLHGAITVSIYLALDEALGKEVHQHLNRDLARNVAAMKQTELLDPGGEPRSGGLEELFHWLMVVNPHLELYLLSPEGEILAWDAPPGAVVRNRVDLGPIRAFLAGDAPLPLLGDDPRHPERRKIFSVAPLPVDGPRLGYLYIVLASEQHEAVMARHESGHVLRIAGATLAGSLLLTGLFGWLLFARLTRPLARLAERMRTFDSDGAAGGDSAARPAAGDEVVALERTFDQLGERIRYQLSELARMADLRRELVANVSHDLRTPLATLQGYLETLSLKEGALAPGERERYLEIALEQSDRLSRRIHDLFELTKLENHDVTPEKETFCLPELVHDNVQRFQLEARAKEIDMKVEVEAEHLFVEADIRLIERAIENLLSNAVRFTPPGGEVRVAVRELGARLEVAISDTGCGIAEDELPYIFERYYRGGEASSAQGSGLGLAITRGILDLHSSPVRVESRPDEGSTFSFALAVAPNLPGTGPIHLATDPSEL